MRDPEESRNYKQYVGLVARQSAPVNPYEGALDVRLKIYRQIPKSMTKKLRKLSIAGINRPVVNPDIDNYQKAIFDALNGIIYKDDSQIVDLNVSKFYSDDPRVQVSVRELDSYADAEIS